MEKEKKEQEKQQKSKSLMAKFFLSKPAKSPAKSSGAQESDAAGPSKIVSDYEKTFKPFVLQKDKTLAPVNWFAAEKKRMRRAALQAKSKEIIVIDTDDEMDIDPPPRPSEAQLANMSAHGRFLVCVVSFYILIFKYQSNYMHPSRRCLHQYVARGHVNK